MSKLYSFFFGNSRNSQRLGCVEYLLGTVLSNSLFALALVTAIFEYVWRPINCLIPSAFTGSMVKYAESYCQSNSTYMFVEMFSVIDSRRPQSHRRYESYIPWLLLYHTLLLRVPRFLWGVLKTLSSVHLDNLIESALCYRSLNESGRKAESKTTANLLHANYSAVETTETGTLTKITNGWNIVKRYLPFGILSLAAILVALAYALVTMCTYNQVCQFLQLGNTSYDYGWRQMQKGYQYMNIQEDTKIEEEKTIFPSTFYCDLDMRAMGTVQKYTLQCFLPLKRFYDPLFVVLWFVYNLAHVLAWLAFARILITSLLAPLSRRCFIRQCLTKSLARPKQSSNNVVQQKNYQTKVNLEEFIKNHMLTDGYFVLKSLSENVDDIFVYDVVNQLWSDVNGPPAIGESIPTTTNDEAKAPLLTPQGWTSNEVSRM